jgi:hypothetical protein
MPDGYIPATKGDPLAAASAPVLGLIAYADTFELYLFETKTNFPVGSIATSVGFDPVVNGEPRIGESAPLLELIVNAETFALLLFET